MKTLHHLLSVLTLLAALAAPTARAQDPEEFPGVLVVSAPPEEAGAFIAGVCDVGTCLLPPPEGVGPARLVPGRDPGNPPSDPDEGCAPFTNADEVEGNLVLVRSGGCGNLDKLDNARSAGAIGLVIYHDETVGPDDDSTLVNISFIQGVLFGLEGLFISRYRGERLLAAHEAGQEVIAEMMMNPDVVAAEPPPEASPFSLSVTPNPARGAAVVRVEAVHPSEARLAVYDALGREVGVLHGGPLGAGPHAFRLPAGLRSGAYLVRLVAGEGVAVRRVVVLR